MKSLFSTRPFLKSDFDCYYWVFVDNTLTMRVKIYFDARAQSAKSAPMTYISKSKADGQPQPSKYMYG